MSARRHKPGSGYSTSMSARDRRARFRALLRRDGLSCYHCGERMVIEPRTDEEAATLDHVKPLALGGQNDLGNLVLSHRRCNEEHGRAVERELKAAATNRGKSLDTGSAGR